MKVILSFYRDDEGSAFKRHRGRVPFDIEKHVSMEIACKHLIEFMGIKQQAEKFDKFFNFLILFFKNI